MAKKNQPCARFSLAIQNFSSCLDRVLPNLEGRSIENSTPLNDYFHTPAPRRQITKEQDQENQAAFQ
jgi:hypothetical protein